MPTARVDEGHYAVGQIELRLLCERQPGATLGLAGAQPGHPGSRELQAVPAQVLGTESTAPDEIRLEDAIAEAVVEVVMAVGGT